MPFFITPFSSEGDCVQLARSVLAAPAASVDFDNLPNHRAYILICRASETNANGVINVAFNGDTTAANYTYRSGTTQSGSNRAIAPIYTTANDTSISYFVVHNDGTGYRILLGHNVVPASPYTSTIANVWASTDTISRITLATNQTSFAIGSVFEIWGLT